MSEKTFGMLQGPSVNCFACLGKLTVPSRIDVITNETVFTKNGLSVFISTSKSNDICFSVGLQKLLDYLVICFSEQNDYRSEGTLNREIMIDLKEYTTLLGVHNTFTVLDEINNELEVLRLLSIEYSSPNRASGQSLSRTFILERGEINNKRIYAVFTETFAQHINSLYIMQYPVCLLGTSARNPNTYYLGRKIALHNSIKNNQKRGTENILSVQSLLTATPNLPSVEKVSEKNRQYTQLIRHPFEGALDSLVCAEVLEYWHYCAPYCSTLIHGAGSFSDFIKAKITYKLCT